MSKTRDKKAAADESIEGEQRQPGTSALEWAVAGISALGLTVVILYLVISALTDNNGPAQIEIRQLGVTAREDHYIVEFAAANLAGASVAAVEIRGELRDGTEVVEESSVTLDYLPRDSEREGALIFTKDPRAHDLVLSAGGYTDP